MMTRSLCIAAAMLLAAAPARAQLGQANKLPPIPSTRQFTHWGNIERSFDDEEGSTSIALNLPFDDRERGRFVRHGTVRAAELSIGFVHPGRVMTSYPEIVTMMIKVTRPGEKALRAEREGTPDVTLTLDGDRPMTLPAPLVSRNGVDLTNGKARNIEDTYVVVLSLGQFLRVVNAAKVSAQLRELKLEFTGGPLEGMRDLASRITVSP